MKPPIEPTLAAVDAARLDFHGLHYTRHNMRRQEHLASLGLDLDNRTVLEVGAGIGDHTTFFLDRGCTVTSVEPRLANCHLFAAYMRERLSWGYEAARRCQIIHGDVELIDHTMRNQFDVVYCYGVLYHTTDPAATLGILAQRCRELLLLETAVSLGDHEAINPVNELAPIPSQAITGQGCRPTRRWIFNRLKMLLGHAYMPRSQPAHEEFPLDWKARPAAGNRMTRAVFAATRSPLTNPMLISEVPDRQVQC